MPDEIDPRDAKRVELMRLLEADEWKVANSARGDGRDLLPNYKGHFGECAIAEFVIDLVRGEFPMHSVILGSGETGYVFNTHLADGRPLYVKLKIQDDLVVVMSFHLSKHS